MHTRYRRHCTSLLLFLTTIVAAADNEDTIAHCAAISSPDDRIRCLEEALRQSSAGVDSTIGAPASRENGASTGPPDKAPAENNQTVTRADTSDAAHPEIADKDSIGPELIADAPGGTAQTVIAAEEVVDVPMEGNNEQARQQESPPTSLEVEQFGLSQTQRDPDPLESVNAVIVAVDNNPYGKLIFTTDSGQVWRQTDRHNKRYRQIPFDAEIRKGVSGSYFLRPVRGGVAIRVKRIK